MSSWPEVRTVAAFEFLRVFKPKDIVVTLLLFCGGALVFAWLKSADDDSVKAPITVIGDALELRDADHLPFQLLQAHGISEEEARRQIDAGDMRAVIFAREVDDVEVLIRDEAPSWYPQLVALVGEARREAKVRAAGLPEEQLEDVFAEAPIAFTVHAPEDVERKEKLQFLAFACLAGMMLGLFSGTVHLFTGITGEKQNHVTESVLSAIPVQTWIDGKCVGLALVALFSLVTVGGSWAVANQVYGLFHQPVNVPLEVVDWTAFLGFLGIAVLGFAMWFAFFAAVASTIDDPNTSARGMFLFVPAMATGVAFIGLDTPDSGLYRLASLFPLTSPGAMPVRLVSGNPAAWELVLSAGLLLAAIWLFRRAAGKIFAMAMLMRGKELAWREIWRAFRLT